MNIHFIAIGGAIMHSLAIALKRKGYHVTGSDDKIADPAKSNLEREGIMPPQIGFDAANIHTGLDAVILGMHAREDNPELIKAQDLGLKIYSFPEYIYEYSKNKQRVVVAGSHGKTTITSMIMHVLKENQLDFDYLVGARVPGFDTGVKLTEEAPIIILEGDEYFASPIHRESKFMYYKPHAALVSGVAWDHVNIFPDYDGYVKQFEKFAYSLNEWGFITWYKEDEELKKIFGQFDAKVRTRPYDIHPYRIKDGKTYLQTDFGEVPLHVFGEHNLQNISGTKNICNELGITDEGFYKAIATYTGAANRMQLLAQNSHTIIYRDFAHSPSKLKATVHAARLQFPEKGLVAVMELHTFSSLNKDFLKEYAGCMDEADLPIVFYDEATCLQKQMPLLEENFVKDAFGNERIHVISNADALTQALKAQKWDGKVLLLMSSGTFAGLDLTSLSEHILNH